MTAQDAWHLVLCVHFLALSFWTGGIFFMAAIGAPSAYRSMASHAVASQIVGGMLKRLNGIEFMCCFLLLITSFSAFRFVPGAENSIWKLIIGVLLMGGFSLYHALVLMPKLDAAQERIPAMAQDMPGRARFDTLYKRYVGLMAVNGALGIVLIYQSVVTF